MRGSLTTVSCITSGFRSLQMGLFFKKAFTMGFLIYLPFLVIDMVVASTLMSMGMMMLPPTTISMPFKILLFIMADGWNLVIGELVKTFYIT